MFSLWIFLCRCFFNDINHGYRVATLKKKIVASLWLCVLIAIVKRCAEPCALQLYCTSLIYVHSKSKVTESSRMAPKQAKLQIFIQVNLYFFQNIPAGKKLKLAKNDQIWFVITWYRFFIRWPCFQDGHFWVVLKVVV